jgi:microcystin-dependent protein
MSGLLSYNVSPNPGDATPGGGGGLPIGTVAMWLTATPPSEWLLLQGQSLLMNEYSELYSVIGNTFSTGGVVPLQQGGGAYSVSSTLITVTTTGYFGQNYAIAAGDIVLVTQTSGVTGTDIANRYYTVVSAPALNVAGTFTFTRPSDITIGSTGTDCIMIRVNFSLPDARTRTIRGVGTSYAMGSTGGTDTKTLAIGNIPNHSHLQWTAGNAAGGAGPGQVAGNTFNINTVAVGGVVNTDGTNVSGGLGQAFDVVNPYLAINFIIKSE